MKSDLAVAFVGRLVSGIEPLPQRTWEVLRDLVDAEFSPEQLIDWCERSLGPDDVRRIKHLWDHREGAWAQVEALKAVGIRVVTEFDDEYPPNYPLKLGHRAPPVLFVLGQIPRFDKLPVAVVGSRDADEPGLAFAAELGREIAGKGRVLVSGCARGVDASAMDAAFEAGGSVVGVVADSLARIAEQPPHKERAATGRWTLISHHHPSAPFSVGRAMARNKLIFGMAECAIAVSCVVDSGGTWAGAVEALENDYCRLLVRIDEHAPDDNRSLVAKGAVALPSPSQLWETLATAPKAQGELL